MKKKNVASMAMAAMMAAGALPMNAWAAPEVNHVNVYTKLFLYSFFNILTANFNVPIIFLPFFLYFRNRV